MKNPEELLLTGSKLPDMTVLETKLNELDKWKKYEVYEEVPDNRQKTISLCWVCTGKHTEKGKVTEARLVAHVYEEHLPTLNGRCIHVTVWKYSVCVCRILQLNKTWLVTVHLMTLPKHSLRTTAPLVSYIRNSLRFWYYASLSTCCQNLEKKIGVTGKIWEKVGVILLRNLTENCSLSLAEE